MSTIETLSVFSLIVVGVALTYFGYEAAKALLAVSGLAAGAAVGGWLGLLFVPQIAGGEFGGLALLLVIVVLAAIGASIGRVFVPALGRLAVGVLGFSVTALGAIVIFAQGQPMEILTQTVPAMIEAGDLSLLIDRLSTVEFVGGISSTIAFAGVFLLAALGGALSLTYSELILGAGVTIVGASLLAAVLPLVLEHSGVDATGSAPVFSEFWFLVFAVSGLVFELLRHTGGASRGRLGLGQ